ncbi:PREDICTED: uncharacterized protein LOC106743185 [Dinoponera quadriceps]|uniref:Uncharacterized protein LOC106743185 n=1 Tax=Dinoponera quadriceps TaxID=609295 RepID=A0A6P3X322_DINQU|nr:PREDICTED: uncharacterized protein LOC106743185 [Dinoponera quadriceps]XP_014472260.1 PREDICTED: uncharacterized protein LOC106743185 [Dinoponera quadriceps]
MASLSIILRRINAMIRRFKFEELERDVMPIFPEIAWSRVKSKLVKNHKNFTITNAVRIIGEAINNTDFTEKDLCDRLATLEITDISKHSKRRIWYSYELTNLDKEVNYIGKREFEKSLTDEFYNNGIEVNVKILKYNDITFVCIKEKKKKRRQATLVTPFFFALFTGHKYFFCSKKKISSDFIIAIANTLGYKKSKRIKLAGRDVRSLMRMLRMKQQGVLHAANLNILSMHEASDPIIKDAGIDYTQTKQRANYAKQCFSEDPPILESLVIHGPQESIQHSDLASILPSDIIRMNWEFSSHNVARFLTSLIEKRVFLLPLPQYVANFMTLGKNELILRSA